LSDRFQQREENWKGSTMTRTSKFRAVKRRRGSIIEVQGAKGVSYKIKFDLPGDEKYARRTQYKTIRGTYQEAEAELARLTGQAGRGVDLDSGKQTLSGWIETWLTDHAQHSVSMRTFERYAQLLRHHVAPRIGHHALAVVGPLHIERLYNELGQSGQKSRKRKGGAATGLSPRTILHVHRTLFQCLRDAKRLRVISDNPAADVKRRRVKQKGGAGAAQMHVLALDRMLELFDAIKATTYKNVPYELAVLAFDSGARRGELLAARWIDLDGDRRTLRIERAVDETETNGVVIKPEPKNESSRRTITLSTQTVALLRSLWKRQAEDRLKLGSKLPTDALIFPQSIEAPTLPLRPRGVTQQFAAITKAHGFDGFRFHDFRHSCASHMLSRGIPVPDVARHLGHSSPSVTMTVYAHAIPKREGGLGLLDQLMPVPAAAE
jgi:integrase